MITLEFHSEERCSVDAVLTLACKCYCTTVPCFFVVAVVVVVVVVYVCLD